STAKSLRRNLDGRRGPAVGTLLSPEGAEFPPSGLPACREVDTSGQLGPRTTPRILMAHARSSRTGRPYLENCTVDASIFVAKLIRAHGGCLGTRSRRRTQEAAISLGELPTKH